METAIDREYEQFKAKFLQKSGLDLNRYKQQQMQRRINNLMLRHNIKTYRQFFERLEADPKLYKDFIDYLTINVTEFFRTPEKFEELHKKVLPELLSTNPSRLNIWSAGCSTGAEPYSVAMLLAELTPGQKHRILATDIDQEMLIKAKQAEYTAADVKNVPASYLTKYFGVVSDRYVLKDTIKQMVDFKRHNLLTDPYESNFDLILCRNVVIYFTEETKEQIYHKFRQALRTGGVLFVGGTECILNFREIGFQHYLPFFYRKG